MEIYGEGLLFDFKKRFNNASGQVDAWLNEAKEAMWETPHDIKAKYPNASILKESMVVFNIRGNKYRLWVKVWYKHKKVIIKWTSGLSGT